MRKFLVTLSAAAILTFAVCMLQGARPAHADVYYPWCASYGGADSPGVPVCSFMTHQQCLASIQGMGGYCQQNWPPPSAPSPFQPGPPRGRF